MRQLHVRNAQLLSAAPLRLRRRKVSYSSLLPEAFWHNTHMLHVAEVEKSAGTSTCKASGLLSGTAIAFLVIAAIEALVVVFLAKRLMGMRRKLQEKSTTEGGKVEGGAAEQGIFL